jgi:hypothetical protein
VLGHCTEGIQCSVVGDGDGSAGDHCLSRVRPHGAVAKEAWQED